jgi:hypothetical protein
MNTAVINAELMDQYINLTMMTVDQCFALNVIYKCQECTAHLVLYSKVVDGVRMAEATAEDWAKQNKLRQEWLANNPDATYIGWTSI